MNRVIVLLDIAKDLMVRHKEETQGFEEWRLKNPEAGSWRYPGEMSVTPTKLKRLLLVLRQETIRLEKEL